jgi:hypothetical protein
MMILGPFSPHLPLKKHPRRKREVNFMKYRYGLNVIIDLNLALAYEKLYLEHLPNADMYEKSYMHRDVLNQVAITK